MKVRNTIVASLVILGMTSGSALAQCNTYVLYQNVNWCREDPGAIERSKHLLDASVDTNDPGLAVAGYIKCQEHQFCAIRGHENLKKRLDDMLGDLKRRTSNDEKLATILAQVNPDYRTLPIYDVIEFLGRACINKTGEPLTVMNSCSEEHVHLMYKYAAGGRDHTGTKK
ncbi:MAG: hypothetical protein JJ939_15850 [Alphaproteobacteria bacterium]|nr:hypothetical protein [Alphaproteobacteria bacterium]